MSHKDEEVQVFLNRLSENHPECVDPCFMTGMGCGSTGDIELARRPENKRRDWCPGKKVYSGFMVMPFQPKLTTIFKNTLVPFFAKQYAGEGAVVELTRSDDGQRTGSIICEGICRRIQEADFVVVDISVGNHNAFYELGLAYGMCQSVILVAQQHKSQEKTSFGREIAKYLDAQCYFYRDLEPINIGTPSDRRGFRGTNLLWRDSIPTRPASTSGSQKAPATPIAFVEVMRDATLGPGQAPAIRLPWDASQDQDAPARKQQPREKDIQLSFATHIKSDVGLSIDAIAADEDIRRNIGGHVARIKDMKDQEEIALDNKLGFQDFKAQVDDSYFLIVRTGKDCHPMAYFWLGYGHARGKNVIPITQTVVTNQATGEEGIQDLAFDIRAQRHMTFSHKKPDQLRGHLEKVMRDAIRKDFMVWSRKHFWDRFLGSRGEVSIITGALHVDKHMREMVGDWDLRAASELASYLSNQQYRPRIETPIYEHNDKSSVPRDRYMHSIVEDLKLAEKNCIVIASPDVNPLTEIAFGRLYGVEEDELFTPCTDVRSFINRHGPATIVTKRKKHAGEGKPSVSEIERAFYREETADSAPAGAERGLKGTWISFTEIASSGQPEIMLPYKSQNVDPSARGKFSLYAHLAIARNPFQQSNDSGPGGRPKYLIVLNGVSGPATFALTHVLTGGVNADFTLYMDREFDPHVRSESILELILSAWEKDVERDTDRKGIQCVVKVDVDKKQGDPGSPIYDWRMIAGWDCVGNKAAAF